MCRSVCSKLWRASSVCWTLQVPEVIRRVLLGMLEGVKGELCWLRAARCTEGVGGDESSATFLWEAVEGQLCSLQELKVQKEKLEKLEVIHRVLSCTLEVLEGKFCLLEVLELLGMIPPVQLCMLEIVEG